MTFTTFDVLDNIVDLLKNDWITEFGKRPSIVKQYTETVRGNVMAQNPEDILVRVDTERSEPFDLGAANADILYHNTTLVSIDVYTNEDDKRMNQLASAIHTILKQNVSQTGENFKYRRIRLGETQNLSDRIRKQWRMVIDVIVETYQINIRHNK